MDKKEITLIFKELAVKNYNEQKEKYTRPRNYREQYFCSEDEVQDLIKVLDKVLDDKDQMSYEHFLNLFEEDKE